MGVLVKVIVVPQIKRNLMSYNRFISYVLTAMEIDKDIISSAIRISWGAASDEKLVKENIQSLLEVAKSLSF